MPVDETILARARDYDRDAIEHVLESVYGSVHRMAHGLTGREDVARGIVRFVMVQSLRRLGQFRDGEAPRRWFQHHTILIWRRAVQHQPSPADDLLVREATHPDAAYIAFVRAMRALPIQQREAFILHYGERLDLRQLAIAMDCSIRAAEMHLHAAHASLEPMAGDAFPALRARLAAAYARLAPSQEIMRPCIRDSIRRGLRPRRAKRLVILMTLVAAALGGWWAWRHYGHLLPLP